VRNLLVTYLYDLGADFPVHKEIHDLCVASYEKNLRGDWEHVCFTGAFDEGSRNRRYGMMLQDVFGKLFDLQDANLFIVDADTLCVRPVDVFGRWNKLTMFNLANARVPYNAFPREQYVHSGVRYVPAWFPLWEPARVLRASWDFDVWAYDQFVWNLLYRSQGVDMVRVKEHLDPRYCWCTPREYDNLDVPEDDAYIVHFHETRNVRACLERMRGYAV